MGLQSSVTGVFAVGDVRLGSVKRVGGAIGEGAAVVAQLHAFLGNAPIPPQRQDGVAAPPVEAPRFLKISRIRSRGHPTAVSMRNSFRPPLAIQGSDAASFTSCSGDRVPLSGKCVRSRESAASAASARTEKHEPRPISERTSISCPKSWTARLTTKSPRPRPSAQVNRDDERRRKSLRAYRAEFQCRCRAPRSSAGSRGGGSQRRLARPDPYISPHFG